MQICLLFYQDQTYMESGQSRCTWCTNDQIYIDYHDHEWGRPVHEDEKLFEFLILEGAQAGLNWLTILKKRASYRLAFAGFQADIVARFTEEDKINLLSNLGIIRNSAKINSAINNARLFLDVQQEFGSFDAYIWAFMPGNQAIINHWKNAADIPASTEISVEISKNLRKRGFTFAGPVICYAFMQATGMVDDHLSSCYRNHSV